MEQYIPRAALVAEIDRRITNNFLLQQKPEMSDLQRELQNRIDCLNSIRGYILNTLEVKEVPIWEKVSPDTGQTTLYKDGGKSYLERFGYRIDLKDLDKLPKKNLKAQKGEEV